LTTENKYPIIQYPTENFCFISVWDEEIGPKIAGLYPRINIGDIEDLAIQIFTAYEYFWDVPETKFERASFTLPVRKINKKAKVLLDSIPNSNVRGGFQPYIVVLLAPDFFTKKKLNAFDDILRKISQDYSHIQDTTQEKLLPLENYYQEIKNRFELIEYKEEIEPEISEYYSYTAAVEDFKAGVNLFKQSNYNQAYELLKKVLAKFKQEKHHRLMMEVIYLIGSIFAQQKRFKNAQEYFQKLEKLANRLDHERFREISTFMDGFCYYKKQKFENALDKFKDLELYQIKYVNKLRFFTIYGKTLNYIMDFEAAEQKFLNALDLTEEGDIKNKQKQQAHLNYELGIINYRIAFQYANNIFIYNEQDFKAPLEKTLRYFKKSSQILTKLEEWDILTHVYSYLSNINELLDNEEAVRKYLYLAFDAARKDKKILKMVNILLKIIKKQANTGQFQDNVKLLTDFLSKYEKSRVIDLFTKAVLYRELGRALILSRDEKKGLTKLLEAHEIFKSLSTSLFEDLKLLKEIKKIYEKQNNKERMSEITEEINELSKSMDEERAKPPEKIYPLGALKEIWIFSGDSGLLIYSYAPETGIDHDLIGGFLTALKQLSIQVTQQELKSITIGKDRYTLYQAQGYNFFILGRSSLKSSSKTITKILEIIYKRFWKEYSKELKSFSGNIDIFSSFTDIVNSFDFTLIN